METSKELDAFLGRSWKRADGTELPVLAVGVDPGDCGNYMLKRTRSRFARGIIAVKGGNQALAPIVSAACRNNRYRAAALTVGTDLAKSMIYSRLKQTEPGPGTMHFPKGRGFDAEFYSELTAEELRFKIRRGFRVREWHKTRLRNEALDVRVYAFAVLRWLNPDFVRVAALQKRKADARVERPADPNEAGHIDPAPGTTPRSDQVGPKVVKRRPAKSPVGFRSFTRGWRRY